MTIGKIAAEKENFQRKIFFEKRARDGWKTILEHYMKLNQSTVILLPAYIGWSPNEGSGIFDPIIELNMKFDFYRITSNLQIDPGYFRTIVQNYENALVLLVHYFGFPDQNYQIITKWLVDKKVSFVEDCAHALFSDEIGGICGRKGDFAFYSLHKLFPFSVGGMVRMNNLSKQIGDTPLGIDIIPYWDYDLYSIYNIRRENYNTLLDLLSSIPGIKVLFDKLPDGVCPQTFPVLLEKDRDRVYHAMNAAGYGLVSLYHTMINEIEQDRFELSYTISKQIINFPLHQDCSADQLIRMVNKFKEIYLND